MILSENRFPLFGIMHYSSADHEEVRMNPVDKRRSFRALHQSGCFVIPNPWNAGSARYLQGLGFKALATTSSGYAHSIGYSDGDVTRDMMLAHCREIATVADIRSEEHTSELQSQR